MSTTFPGESAEYRAARDRLLEQEIELRRTMERVAAARRDLPLGGVVPEDYVFQGAGADGAPTDVKLSELFRPGLDSLVIYSFMFPRDPRDRRPGPPSTPASGSTSRSSRRHRCRESSRSPMSAAGDGETVRHFWGSELFHAPTDPGQDPRHVGTLEPVWNLFDLTPEGRGTDWDEQLSYS